MISGGPSTSSEMAAASTFSYAQAAKSASSPQTSQASGQPIPTDSATLLDDASATDSVRPSNADKLDWDSIVGSESDIRSESVPRQPEAQKEDRPLGRLERPWRRADRESLTSTSGATAKSIDDQDSRKPRKGKKKSDKAADDKEAEEQPKVELSEAPIPTVNIWQQRREAQAVKPTPSEEPKKTAKPAESAAAAPPTSTGPVIVNGAKFVRKSDGRNGTRGTRVAEKEAKDAKATLPPSVNDANLWPTPETVVQEDKKTVKVEQQQQQQQQQAQQQTTPKEAQDDSAPKPRSKEKWVAYDYVPTVSFETQIPQMRNSKPRGGARNVNGAARNNQSGEKAPAAAAAQQTKAENRNRRESANGTHAASQPPSKRGSMDVAQAREQRKAANAEKAKEATSNTNVRATAWKKILTAELTFFFSDSPRTPRRPRRPRTRWIPRPRRPPRYKLAFAAPTQRCLQRQRPRRQQSPRALQPASSWRSRPGVYAAASAWPWRTQRCRQLSPHVAAQRRNPPAGRADPVRCLRIPPPSHERHAVPAPALLGQHDGARAEEPD